MTHEENGMTVDNRVPSVDGADEYDPFHGEKELFRGRFMHNLLKTVLGDIDYTGTNRDDEVWWQVHALEESNGLPLEVTADEIYNLYRTNYQGEQ